mmetsp:Transcript_31152/g.49968  ORF Transcript_31152/g.49968 Transcript_31152/m.49968 type:complete len:876 (-) Transcript_31152:1462-4089(-)
MDVVSDYSSDAEHKSSRRKRVWLASRLWPHPLNAIVKDPKRTFFVWGIVNGVFIGIGEVVNGIIWLLTLPGFVVLVTVGVYALVYNIARAIVYPGLVPNVRRSLERDIAKEVKRSLLAYLGLYCKLFQVLCNVCVHKGRFRSDIRTKTELATLMSKLVESRGASLMPLVETLEYQKTNQAGKLDHGGEALLGSLKRLVALDEMFLDFQLGPAVGALEKSGTSALVDLLAPSFKSVSFDVSKYSDHDMSIVSSSSVYLTKKLHCQQGVDLLDEIQYLQAHRDEILEHIMVVVRLATEQASFIVENVPLATNEEEEEEDFEETDWEGDDEEDVELGNIELEEKPASQSSSMKAIVGGAPPPKEGPGTAFVRFFKTKYDEFQKARMPMQAVGNIDFMRADLEVRLKGRQAFIDGHDGSKIDTMFIPADKPFPDNRTILMCNPNCGIYEFALFQCQWATFYVKYGINVLLYNYRGYARSEGWPSPTKVRADGEKIIDYLIEEMGVQKGWVGVHAESIGGVVACHLARVAKDNISFVVADRTFADLPSTASHLVGAWAGKAVRSIGWHANNVDGFIAAPASVYRVVTCDPNDEIISHLASLKVGIARELVGVATKGISNQTGEDGARVCELTEEYLPPMSSIEWINDDIGIEKFAHACIRFVDSQKDEVTNETLGPRLMFEIQEVVKVLWFTDGKCGLPMGVPLTEYYNTLKELEMLVAQPTEGGSPQTSLDSVLQPEHLENNQARIHTLKDWICCLLLWGPTINTSKATSANMRPLHITKASTVYGPDHPVPLETTLSLLRTFRTEHGLNLERAKLMDPLEIIIEMLERFTTVNIPANRQNNIALIPLTCGHNGRMNSEEEAQLLKHMEKAGWVAGPPR